MYSKKYFSLYIGVKYCILIIDNMGDIMSKKVVSKKTSKKKKQDKNKKLVWLILLLLLLIVLFTSVTYAWFSSNKRATIDTMDINVATVAGIQVSVDGINWKNEVSKEEIINAYKTYPRATNQLPDTLAGCSSDGGVSPDGLNVYYGMIRKHDNEYYITAEKQPEINCVGDEECEGKHYIAFDLFFLVTAPQTLVITSQSSVVNRNAIDDGGQNSARVGFVVLGNVTDTASGVAAQNLKNASSSVIWEPNYDVHTKYGVRNAQQVYGITTTETGGSRLPYKGINQNIYGMGVAINRTDSSPYFSLVTPKIATTQTFLSDQQLVTINKGITKMRIYLWLEGQDVDLENNAANGKLRFTLEIAVTDR